jgi:hypothetical protein
MDWTPWLKLLHVAAGFTFALAHGVSAFTTLKLRGERDPARVTPPRPVKGEPPGDG